MVPHYHKQGKIESARGKSFKNRILDFNNELNITMKKAFNKYLDINNYL